VANGKEIVVVKHIQHNEQRKHNKQTQSKHDNKYSEKHDYEAAVYFGMIHLNS